MFQFHNGSIKGNVANASMYKTFEFQFHNGSIKGQKGELIMEAKTMFQFHNGSIKGSHPFCNRRHIVCFNSTMVRLKVFHNCLLLFVVVFQFHNGSIKGLF